MKSAGKEMKMGKARSPTQIKLEAKSTGDKTIDRLVQDYIQNVVAGFGGWSEVLPGEMFMLLSQKICLEIILRCQAELSKQEAMLDAKGKPQSSRSTASRKRITPEPSWRVAPKTRS